MKQFIIQPNDSDQRLDKFLVKAVPLLPKNLLYKYLRKKRIKVNGKRAQQNQRLQVGDIVELYIADEFFEETVSLQFLSAPPDITIVYEDDQILIVDKPQGLVVHEDQQHTQDTLIHRVQHDLYQKGVYLPEEEASFAPALAHRIDRNTCGLVIVAKTAAALRMLNQKIKHQEIEKIYLCLVVGTPPKSQDTLTHYHKKDSRTNSVSLSTQPAPDRKVMRTTYRLLEHRNDLSLLEVTLHTGRSHQIRAHMAQIGCPLLGDHKYGKKESKWYHTLPYQALCAYQLRFTFRSDAGMLEYLNGQTMTADTPWFVTAFRQGLNPAEWRKEGTNI